MEFRHNSTLYDGQVRFWVAKPIISGWYRAGNLVNCKEEFSHAAKQYTCTRIRSHIKTRQENGANPWFVHRQCYVRQLSRRPSSLSETATFCKKSAAGQKINFRQFKFTDNHNSKSRNALPRHTTSHRSSQILNLTHQPPAVHWMFCSTFSIL